ncbi:bifunctional hydroxymethylpyrimidine kinase/phosphomethylpyrimidine kinase [Hoeflea sp. TYP-13]|uniref:bifunctional hydroxymethylpyrimidine kinase/phosphomethylpyrimidine kinase n=1 Tax=Hoeflea sp. TYP-13 TaxID=3230023 RepID=UPI0034C677B2
MTIPNILTIAGSDPSGGAGIQADLKTIAANGGYGMSVVTALTAQNTDGVRSIQIVDCAFVRDQITAVLDDIRIDAIKIGMLANAGLISTVADCLRRAEGVPVILDPVCMAKGGARLLEPGAISALKSELAPLATILTPNLPEAAELLAIDEPASRKDMTLAANALLSFGSRNILLKGGHLGSRKSCDLLVSNDTQAWLEAERIDTANTHGTGCTLSSAIATLMPQSTSVLEAVAAAKDYIHGAILHSGMLSVGRGHGPVHHAWRRV